MDPRLRPVQVVQVRLRRVAGDNETADIGAGHQDKRLVLTVPTAFTAGGAATLTITLESDSTADLATSPTVHLTVGPIAVADLTEGAVLADIAIPKDDYEEYIGVRYTVATGPMTAGNIDANIVLQSQDNRSYANRSTISV